MKKAPLKPATPPTPDTTASEPTNSQKAQRETQSGPDVFDVGTITWDDGFAMAVMGKPRRIYTGLKINHHEPPIEKGGEAWPFGVARLEFAEDKTTILRHVGEFFCRTLSDAIQARKILYAEIIERESAGIALQKSWESQKSTIAECDLREARMIVLRDQFPNTFKAKDAMSKAPASDLSAAAENVFRAYAVDLARLLKPKRLSDVFSSDRIPDEWDFIEQLVSAGKEASPYDAVDVELASRWLAAGYHKMSAKEFTEAINEKTGSQISGAAMKQRAYRKLGLMTSKPPGRPSKISEEELKKKGYGKRES